MTGILENPPGVGHNKPESKMRGEGKSALGALVQEAHLRPRARRNLQPSLQVCWSSSPACFLPRMCPGRAAPAIMASSIISPQHANVTQSIETHIEAYAPGAYGQKHGHLNSAVFYVLKGHGHDVHDGRVIPWKAGDVMLVENGCVHQHFNDSPDEEAILLVFKAKPLVPVHAPAVPEDRRMAAENSTEGRRRLHAAG